MTLKQQLTEDMKQALKAHDSFKLGTIRLIIAEVKNFEIDNGEQDDAGVLKIIAKMLKQMQDAKTEYAKGNRADLVAEEEQKIQILKAYLPEQMSDEELRAIVSQTKQELENANFGMVMKEVMKKVNGKADGQRVSQMVREVL